MRIDVNWGEQQHFNYLIKILEETSKTDEELNKKRKLTPQELLKVLC